MKDKIASLVEQIRKCASDLDFLAEEEEAGFTAGLERESQKIANRIERVAYELDELETKYGLELPDLTDLTEEEEEVLSAFEEEDLYTENLEEKVEEEKAIEEDEVCGSEEEEEVIAPQKSREEILNNRQAAKLKYAGLTKVACVCTKCAHNETVAMTTDEIEKLAADFKAHKGEIYGPECEKCTGELIPQDLLK